MRCGRQLGVPETTEQAPVARGVRVGAIQGATWSNVTSTVKGMGFDKLLLVLAGVALCTAFTVLWLPSEEPAPATAPA